MIDADGFADKALFVEIRKGLKIGEALHYVPIQKMTLAVLGLALDRCCDACSSNGCDECAIFTARNKLTDAINLTPFMDENFNILPPPAQDGKDSAK